MGFHGGGWFSFLSDSGEKPKVTPDLLRRVMGYSKPYRWQLVAMLLLILLHRPDPAHPAHPAQPDR